MSGISLKHIYKTYPGGSTAVQDFCLEIQDKEFIILVGPSGCGKSTTLRMIAGLEEITQGELYIGENLVNDVPPKDRNIAMVFQNYALYPHMTVFKNMAFGLQLRKVPKSEIKRKVEEVAKILEIEDYLDRKPKTLSGGQRQRVALGRAMVRDPAAFLLDEPLSNLDAKLRVTMRAEITRLHKRLGTTFVYVTHDQTEAMTMGDRIVVMKDGVIQQVDTPQNLYDFPRNMFVAGFIGAPPMNFMSAVIRKSGDGFAAMLGNSALPVLPDRVSADTIASYDGKQVTLGIRPEDLSVGAVSADLPAGCIDVEVDLVEHMGASSYIYAQNGNTKLIVTAPSDHNVKMDENIRLAVNCSKMHIFDPETEQAMSGASNI